MQIADWLFLVWLLGWLYCTIVWTFGAGGALRPGAPKYEWGFVEFVVSVLLTSLWPMAAAVSFSVWLYEAANFLEDD